jgi:hypothetical protein
VLSRRFVIEYVCELSWVIESTQSPVGLQFIVTPKDGFSEGSDVNELSSKLKILPVESNTSFESGEKATGPSLICKG